MKILSFKAVLIGVILVDLASVQHSVAASAVVTGGDPTDGVNLTGTLVGAVFDNNYTGVGNLTFQGYTFTSESPYTMTQNTAVSDITINSSPAASFKSLGPPSGDTLTPTNAGFTNPTTPSANDTALLALVGNGIVYNSGTAPSISVTFGNIVAGQQYDVTFLTTAFNYGTYPRTQTLNYSVASGTLLENGVAPAAETISFTNSDSIVATSDILTASANGTLTATLTSGNQVPLLDAVIITEVPEPSTAVAGAAMMIGVLLFLGSTIRRRLQA